MTMKALTQLIVIIMLGSIGEPGAVAAAQSAADPLANRIAAALHDAESMAVRSGQPRESIVFEIAKAVRSVVWSSGERPSAVVAALRSTEALAPLSCEALQALRIIEREMAED